MAVARNYHSGPINVSVPISKGSSLEDCCDSIVGEFLICLDASLSHKSQFQKYTGLILFNCEDMGFMELMRGKINEAFQRHSMEHFKILKFPNNHEVSIILGEERYVGVDINELINRGYLQYTPCQ